MENNITNINEMSQEQIMEAIGQDDGSNKGINIPRNSDNLEEYMSENFDV